MREINYLVKIILVFSAFSILECAESGSCDDASLSLRATGGSVAISPVKRDCFVVSLLAMTVDRYYTGYTDEKSLTDSFEITRIRPDKIFTPNGDGWNDYFEIRYENPYDASVNGKIYDIKGRLVANMEKKDENGVTLRLIWNGNDLNDNPVTGGLYIYQVEVSGPENKLIKGTIILVK